MTDNRKKRCKVVEFWIDVGKECRVRHNYNSLMAIISALNMTSVTRLKKMWATIRSKSAQDIKDLESVLDPSSNFKNYRKTIAALPEDAPCIPFFSLLVKDIYFIKEGSKRSPNGHINFERFWPISECLAEFRIRQQHCERMVSVPRMFVPYAAIHVGLSPFYFIYTIRHWTKAMLCSLFLIFGDDAEEHREEISTAGSLVWNDHRSPHSHCRSHWIVSCRHACMLPACISDCLMPSCMCVACAA